MNLHRRHKANKRATVTRSTKARPEICIEVRPGVFFVVEGQNKCVRVLLVSQNKDGRKQLDRFCHSNGLFVNHEADGWSLVTGTEYGLLMLDHTRFWANPLISEWHWVTNAHVCGGSGAGENPKRQPETTTVVVKENKVRVAIGRMTPTSREGMKDVRTIAEQELAHR